MRVLPIALAAIVTGACLASAAALAGVTAQSSVPGARVEVIDLKRDGAGAVTLTLTITNGTNKDIDLGCELRAESNEQCKQVTGIYWMILLSTGIFIPVSQCATRHSSSTIPFMSYELRTHAARLRGRRFFI